MFNTFDALVSACASRAAAPRRGGAAAAARHSKWLTVTIQTVIMASIMAAPTRRR
jgi:hypothetical protein